MTVVLVDPRRPTLIPVEACALLCGDIVYTEELPIAVPWSLPAAQSVLSGAEAAVAGGGAGGGDRGEGGAAGVGREGCGRGLSVGEVGEGDLGGRGPVGGGGGGAAVAAPACAVDYTPNQWATGFTAEVAVTNRAAPVTTWTLTWTYAGNQAVTSAWNAQVAQSGNKVTARDVGWNGQLGTGATARFGFQGTYSGTNAAPVDFALNGTPCNGDAPPTSTT